MLTLCLLTAPVVEADETRHRAAQARFLRDRDVSALVASFDAATPPGERALALRAAHFRRVSVTDGDESPPAVPADAQGRLALAHVVDALHTMDLTAARRALTRADRDGGGAAVVWASALVRARGGDDAAALSRLMAPPLFEWERDAFQLALLGAALSTQDRDMLAATGRMALLRAASRDRAPAVLAMSEALAALDPGSGAMHLTLGVRALRRAGDTRRMERLLAVAQLAGISPRVALIAVERAIAAWRVGRTADVHAVLKGVQPPLGAQQAVLGLNRAGHAPRLAPVLVEETRTGLPHADEEALHAAVLARACALISGSSCRAEDVMRAVQERGGSVTDPNFAPYFLRARRLVVLSVVGDEAVGRTMIENGYPFLLFRLVRHDAAYRDAPVLVRGFDPRTNLWIVEEPHLERLDVLPRTAIRKSRLVCAVRAGADAQQLVPLAETAAARQGGVLESALQMAARGNVEGAIERLAGYPHPAGASTAAFDLYLGSLHYHRATAHRDEEGLARAREALDRSRKTRPTLGFEHYVRGQALVVAGERRKGLAALDVVAQLEGPSARLALTRFAALRAEGRNQEALEAANLARRLAPLDTRVMVIRAATLEVQGDRDEAVAEYRRALDRDPSEERVAIKLAELQIAGGKPGDALGTLRDVARRAPELAGGNAFRMARRRAEFAVIDAADTLDALKPFRRSADPDTRRHLAFVLARRPEPEAEAVLRSLLSDEDTAVQITTLRIYMRGAFRGKIEEDGVLGRVIVQMLRKGADGNVRVAAAGVLARVVKPFSRRALAGALVGEQLDPDPAVRATVANALSRFDSVQAAEALVGALDDRDVGVRKAAFDSLFRLAGKRMDYDPEAEPAARAAALARWQAWLKDRWEDK